jgi:putative hemolysin
MASLLAPSRDRGHQVRKAMEPKLSYISQVKHPAQKAVVNSIELLSGRQRLEDIYEEVLRRVDAQESFWRAALEELQVQLVYDPDRLAAVPQQGPLIFIANHPYGVLDGLALCHFASLCRQEFRILVSSALCREDRLTSYLLPIDFDDSEQAVRTNIESRQRAVETLRRGGALVIFPAGGISTSLGPFGAVTDLEWKLFTAKLVHLTQATVVPLYFYGQNSRLFQIVSHISLTLRLSLIIHEVHKQMTSTLRVAIGDPIPYEQLAAFKSRQALTDHLRRVVYSLGHQAESCSRGPMPASKLSARY